MDEVEAPEVEVGEIASVEPEVFDVSDDGQYRFGEDDPISGADLKGGWLRQDDYTRKTQELSERRAEWEKQKATEAQAAQQYQQQLQRHYEQQYQQQLAQAQRVQTPSQDPRAEIWEKAKANGGIVTVDEARALDQQWSQAFEQQAQHNARLLQAMGMLNDRVNTMQAPLTELQSSRAESQITSRLNSFMDDRDIPPGEARNNMASYLKEWEPTPEERMQGHDLEDAWDAMLSTFTGSSKEIELSQANAAAKNLGRAGGRVAPSNGVKPPMTVDEIVEATWKK